MESILNEKGLLTVELGETWLSRSEAESIKPGDIVKLTSFAGEQVKVKYNGDFIGTGEMVILDNNWAVRLEGVVDISQRKCPLNSKNLTEFLPVTVRMGTLSISLQELTNLKIGSVINLDETVARENGTLFIAGIFAAAGEVATIYDNFALSIIKTKNPPQKRDKMISGNLLEAGFTDYFRIYDFRKPDMFSRLAICKIRDIHCNVIRSLKNRYPQMEKWSLISLDEQNFSDSFESYEKKGTMVLTARDRHYSLMDSKGNSTGDSSEDDFIISGELIQSESASQPLSESEFDKERESGKQRITREEGLIYIVYVGGDETFSERVLVSQITACWRHLTDYDFTTIQDFTPFKEKKKDLDGLFRFGINVHLGPYKESKEGFYILYPYITLSPVNKLLSF